MTCLCQMRFQIWTITREEAPSSGYSAGAFVNLIIDDGHVACTPTYDVAATSGSCCATDADGDTAQAVAQGALVPPTTLCLSDRLWSSNCQQPKPLASVVSGTESDSDSVLSPDLVPPSPYAGAQSFLAGTSQPPLSAIAERRSHSGEEDSDEEQDGEAMARIQAAQETDASDIVLKSGYLWKKGERRKASSHLHRSSITAVDASLCRHGKSGGLCCDQVI
jgi:hypothetical protein